MTNPLRVILERLHHLKDEDNFSKPKFFKIIENYDIHLYDGNDEYRDLYDIVKDIASIWDKLSTDEKSYFNDIASLIKNIVSSSNNKRNDNNEKNRIVNFSCGGCRINWSANATDCKKRVYATESWYYTPCPRCRIEAATRWD